MTNQERLQALFAHLDEIEAYFRVLGKVHFDMSCCAPPEGMARAGEDMAILGKQVYQLTHAPEYTALLTDLHQDSEGLTPVQKKAVEHLYEHWAREKNISPELSFEMDMAASHSYSDWLEAKQASDFSKFRDSLPAHLPRHRRLRRSTRSRTSSSTGLQTSRSVHPLGRCLRLKSPTCAGRLIVHG